MANKAQILPTSLWKFYLQYGIKDYKFLLICWMVGILISMADGVFQPTFQRWIVALFENPVPDGVSFIQYALPTIILITALNIIMTGSALLRDTVSSHLWPRLANKISESLTTYTHQQSMNFWTSKMPGSISAQITYVVNGIKGGLSELWWCVARLMVICINGALLFAINTWVAYLFIVSLVFRVWYAWRMRGRVKKASEEASGARSSLSGKLVDSFSNYSIVKSFAGAEKERKILDTPRQKMLAPKCIRVIQYGYFGRSPDFYGICYLG